MTSFEGKYVCINDPIMRKMFHEQKRLWKITYLTLDKMSKERKVMIFSLFLRVLHSKMFSFKLYPKIDLSLLKLLIISLVTIKPIYKGMYKRTPFYAIKLYKCYFIETILYFNKCNSFELIVIMVYWTYSHDKKYICIKIWWCIKNRKILIVVIA